LRTRRNVCLLPFALLAFCLVLAAAAGCGGQSGAAAPSRSEYTGVIVDIERVGSDVRAFTLESDGEAVRILIADDVQYGFDLGHLRDHMATRAPVRCPVEDRGGQLYALAILDA
jgi:hypothetical protein